MMGCSTAGKPPAIPGADLFTHYGWAVTGEVSESENRLPPDFRLRSGSVPWAVYRDLSRDINLDFTAHAGEAVRVVEFRVADKQGARLEEISAKYDLRGVVLVSGDQAIGAWLTYTERDGTRLEGIPGYSLQGKDLERVTGMQWPDYARKLSADHFRDYAQVIRSLTSAGLTVTEVTDASSLCRMHLDEHLVKVDQIMVHICTFPEDLLVTARDGSFGVRRIGSDMAAGVEIDWAERPYAFQKHNVLALFATGDASLADRIVSALEQL